jgi:glycosyltransferase involved in cell wall biosynthesis
MKRRFFRLDHGKDQMKILLLTNHFNAGGITSYLTTLSGGLVKQGHTVIIASGDGECVANLEALGVRHVPVGLNVKCEWHPAVWIAAFRLATLVKNEHIDIIHANTRSSQWCAAVVMFLRRVPYVTTCHGFFRPRIGRLMFPLWGQAVLAISPQVQEHLIRDLHVNSTKVRLVQNGIDVEKFRPLTTDQKIIARRRWRLPPGLVIGIVARLSDVKGHEFLILSMPGIMRDFPSVVCAIFGVGPEERTLRKLVREQDLQRNVFFYDAVNKAHEIIPLMDVFVVPSLQEGIGLSIMEAGACGVPVVASRVGGIPEVVTDGENGLLVPPGDPTAIARAVSSLLGDPVKARNMGLRAREIVAEKFSAERMINGTESVYNDICSRKEVRG